MKDITKFINQTRKKYNYHWDKEGEDLLQKIKNNNFEKKELKNILSILLLTENIPNNFISKLWISSAKILENISNSNKQYNKLVKAYDILIKRKHPLYLFLDNKISVDLNRSFNAKNVKVTGENIIQLKNILNAFTVRNVSLNYCQGYNTIAAFILQMTEFKEEESYYLFIRLMEDILPYDYYLFGIGIEAETTIVQQIINKYEPDITKHFGKIEGGELIIFGITMQFITSLFTFNMDINIAIFFYNIMFGFYSLEEKKENIYYYFYKIILAIFKTYKNEIFKCKTDKDLNDVLNLEKISKEKIMYIIYFTLFDNSETSLDITYVQKIRGECINKIVKEKKIKFKYNNEKGLKCDEYYPICLEESTVESKLYLNCYYSKGINNKENWNENNNIIINDENEEEEILRDIIIERRKHHCKIKTMMVEYDDYTWEKEGIEIFEQMKNNNQFDKQKLKKILSILLLKQNITYDLIPKLWISCTKLEEIINKNKDQYRKMLKAFDILIKNKHPFYIYIQNKILIDLNRTCSKDNLIEKNKDKIKNILHAFTIRNASIYYCQGLNNIVYHFLKMTNFLEEESFYLFVLLLEEILPYDYYLFGLGIETDLNVIQILITMYEPDLMTYFDKTDVTNIINGFLTQFITSLFTFKMDINITNFLFNCFFGFYLLEENKDNLFYYFYKIILGIFRAYKDDILRSPKNQEITDIINFEKEHSREYINNIIYYTLFESQNEFDLNEAKNIRRIELNKILKEKNAKFNFENKEGIKCNIIYPICVEEGNITSPIHLKVKYENIENKDENIIKNEEENDEDILKDIIIERRKHYCDK